MTPAMRWGCSGSVRLTADDAVAELPARGGDVLPTRRAHQGVHAGVAQRVLKIFGIYQQTSMLSNDMWQNDMRYCGESWGRLSKPAPISQGVRYAEKMTRNIYALPRVPMDMLVGPVVTNEPGNLVGLGLR